MRTRTFKRILWTNSKLLHMDTDDQALPLENQHHRTSLLVLKEVDLVEEVRV